MAKPIEIEAVLSYGERLPAVDVWLVIDILRASTVMVRWFELGGGDLYPSDSVEEARATVRRLTSEGHTPLLMGEQNGVPPQGFDVGNSPLELTPEVIQAHSCAVMATTNGTRSLHRAASSGVPVFVACARNAAASLNAALAKGSRLGIFCAGREGRPAWDDALCAGLLIDALRDFLPVRLADGARLALLTWRSSLNLHASLSTADHAVFLKGIGFGEDIAFASHIDADRSVPELLRLERPDGQGADIVLREGFSRDTPPVVYPRIV